MNAARRRISGAVLFSAGLILFGSLPAAFCAPAVSADSISASSWSLLVEAALGGMYDSSARLGVRSDATSDFDPAYDQPSPPHPPGNWVQVYFPHADGGWPTLLGDRFAVDIRQPASPAWMMKVESSLPPGALALTWDTTGLGTLPPGYMILLRDSAADVTVDMRLQPSYAFAYGGPRTFSVAVVTAADVSTITVAPKWNIVSVPRLTADSSAAGLFPTATSAAYFYNGTYQTRATLGNGIGYWLKFSAQEQVTIGGSSIPTIDVPAEAGWNLVGAVDHPVPAPSGGVIGSQFFEYIGRYAPADTLRPGQGYWVKASGAGMITIGAPGAFAKARSDLLEPSVTLTVRACDGARQSVYLLTPSSGLTGSSYELPPVPPRGSFDVRFTSGQYAETDDPSAAEGSVHLLRVQSALAPFLLEAESTVGARVECSLDGASWQPLPMRLEREAVVMIRVRGAGAQPSRFALEQNYPNPFNPSTTIRYTLPERSRVRLTVVTPLGETVDELADETQPAGIHQARWDAARGGLASGVYWYRIAGTGLETGRTFDAARKLILVK